ncbi:MAG: hypothetical protein ACOC0A_04820 [Planctomycetota bacterium]
MDEEAKDRLIEELEADEEFRESFGQLISLKEEAGQWKDGEDVSRRDLMRTAVAGAIGLGTALMATGSDVMADPAPRIQEVGSLSNQLSEAYVNQLGSSSVQVQNVFTENLVVSELGLNQDGSAASLDDIVRRSAMMNDVAVVAPSYDGAYDTASAALEDGNKHILIAETFKDSNIPLTSANISVRGMGRGETIIHRENGEPLFTTQDNDVFGVTLKDLKIRGENLPSTGEYGPSIRAWPEGSNGARLWDLENLDIISGPIVFKGPRNNMRHVRVVNMSVMEFPEKSAPHGLRTRAALVHNGLTHQIWGGRYITRTDSREAAYLSSGGVNIGGGVVFSNEGPVPDGVEGEDGRSDLTLWGVNTLTVGAVSFPSSKQYTVRFGAYNPDGQNLHAVGGGTFVGTPGRSVKFEGSNSHKITWFNPQGDMDVALDRRVGNFDVYANGTEVKMTSTTNVQGGNDVNVVGTKNGAFSIGQDSPDAPTTPLNMPPVSSPPEQVEPGMVLFADGEKWDPVGNGNAALVIYNGTEWVGI